MGLGRCIECLLEILKVVVCVGHGSSGVGVTADVTGTASLDECPSLELRRDVQKAKGERATNCKGKKGASP